MSTILDALRRLQRDREASGTAEGLRESVAGELSPMAESERASGSPARRGAVMAGLLLVAVAAGGALAWQNGWLGSGWLGSNGSRGGTDTAAPTAGSGEIATRAAPGAEARQRAGLPPSDDRTDAELMQALRDAQAANDPDAAKAALQQLRSNRDRRSQEHRARRPVTPTPRATTPTGRAQDALAARRAEATARPGAARQAAARTVQPTPAPDAASELKPTANQEREPTPNSAASQTTARAAVSPQPAPPSQSAPAQPAQTELAAKARKQPAPSPPATTRAADKPPTARAAVVAAANATDKETAKAKSPTRSDRSSGLIRPAVSKPPPTRAGAAARTSASKPQPGSEARRSSASAAQSQSQSPSPSPSPSTARPGSPPSPSRASALRAQAPTAPKSEPATTSTPTPAAAPASAPSDSHISVYAGAHSLGFPEIVVESIRWHPVPARRVAKLSLRRRTVPDLREGDIVAGVRVHRIDPAKIEFRIGDSRKIVRLGP